MSKKDKVHIRKLSTGVSGLDEILGGGLPEYSFNIIAGSPGCGKTTLAHQIVFANATPQRPSLYFTVLGEPAIKMLRYQQQFDFFDNNKVNTCIRFINLSESVLKNDLNTVLDEIIKEVDAINPGIVVVDSFRTVVRKIQGSAGSEMELQSFVQRLALHMASWQATTFLIGEYLEAEQRDNPVFTVADGLFWLSQQVEQNSIVRKMQIIKLRGQASIPGLHTFRITDYGLQTFPRTYGIKTKPDQTTPQHRLSCGIDELDQMLGGGIPQGDTILVTGPTGSGKSILCSQFIADGLKRGEPGIIVVFEERPNEYIKRAKSFGFDLKKSQSEGILEILYLRPLDLSVDETMYEIIQAVERTGAKRLVIDSLSGFEIALAPGFRADFRESIYRMIGALTKSGVTILSSIEVQETFTSYSFSNFGVSFISDDIIRLRYVSINGQLRRIILVAKMRGGDHSKDIREYVITSDGLVIGERLKGYRALTSGIPSPWNPNAIGSMDDINDT
jgi:circadian clock protein KaiC